MTHAGGGATTITLPNGSRHTPVESTSIVIDESMLAADLPSKSLIHPRLGR